MTRGHHSCSCSENRLGKPHLDHLLETIEGLQKEVLCMRVSHDDKGYRFQSQNTQLPYLYQNPLTTLYSKIYGQGLTEHLCPRYQCRSLDVEASQRIDVFIPNPSHVFFCGTTTTDDIQSWDAYSQVGNCQYDLSALSLNPKHMAVFSSHGSYIYYYTWDGKQWLDRGAIPSLTTYRKPTVI